MDKSFKIKLLLCCLLLSVQIAFSQDKKFNNRFELLSGVRRPKDAQANWDQRYNKQQYIYGKTPADFLSENYKYIPDSSNVLDMGMGEGRNAVFLAGKGYKVIGLSASSLEVTGALTEKYQLNFDFYFCDETALKTIIRSNPSLIELQKGTIVQKLHWNDASKLKLSNNK